MKRPSVSTGAAVIALARATVLAPGGWAKSTRGVRAQAATETVCTVRVSAVLIPGAHPGAGTDELLHEAGRDSGLSPRTWCTGGGLTA